MARQRTDGGLAPQLAQLHAPPEPPFQRNGEARRGERVEPDVGERSLGAQLGRIHLQLVANPRAQKFLDWPTRLGARLGVHTAPPPDDVERSIEECSTTGAALDLAARGTGDRILPQQHDLRREYTDARGEFRAHGVEERVVVFGRVVSRDFERQYQLLAALGADAECRRVPGTQVRVAALRCELDVVRVEVPPLQDDQILQPPGDEQVAAAQGAEVTRAQVARARAGGEPRTERRDRFRCAPPVAVRDARARDPDLTDGVVSHLLQRVGIDDAYVVLER